MTNARRSRVGKGVPTGGQFKNEHRKPVMVANDYDAWMVILGPYSVAEWESAGFSLELAKNWIRTEFTPREARSWLDNGFDPDEAVQWKADFFTPECALSWKEAGVGLEEASRWAWLSPFGVDEAMTREWRELGFAPDRARSWRNAGFGSKAAQAWRMQEFSIDEAKSWHVRSFSPQQAAEWRSFGFDVEIASRWAENFEPEEANRWVECGFDDPDTQFVFAWKAIGVEPREAGELAFQGYTPKDHAQKIGADPGLFTYTPVRSFRSEEAEWEAAGVPSLLARQWVTLRFSLSAALVWQAAGVTPMDADKIRVQLTN